MTFWVCYVWTKWESTVAFMVWVWCLKTVYWQPRPKVKSGFTTPKIGAFWDSWRTTRKAACMCLKTKSCMQAVTTTCMFRNWGKTRPCHSTLARTMKTRSWRWTWLMAKSCAAPRVSAWRLRTWRPSTKWARWTPRMTTRTWAAFAVTGRCATCSAWSRGPCGSGRTRRTRSRREESSTSALGWPQSSPWVLMTAIYGLQPLPMKKFSRYGVENELNY